MANLNITVPKIDLLGMPLHAIRMQELIEYCDQAIIQRRNLVLGMINVAKLINSRTDPLLHRSVVRADVIAADGQGIVWLSRLAGKPLPERVAGIDAMYALMALADRKRYRVFFLGAKPSTVRNVVEKTAKSYPGLKVAGYRDGYFDLEKDGRRVAQQIAGSRADILFVAMSSPKKELFVERWKDSANVPVCHGVGGSFDVFSGGTKRAPRWMQKSGLEWFFRILQEPRRMWKRYLITNTAFLFLGLQEIVGSRLRSVRGVTAGEDR